ncbi:hypothetical protein ACFQY4_25490 [Catellatospora bangladeshensis]|uniref:Uncharacterized protein n=1 Tax=Catellatospora bangladeshensis TaxID=310355 RepID=A0A8J3NJL0_9ACTN|nr:hypothetical protein [Catellatospora bangladeshensis]GIF81581.1 hypothetical protein Cba03nite_29300 [Catellatospora bangladeshensis]
MSGTIAVTADRRWSAAGWLFDWTVEKLAEELPDAAAAGDMHEIVEANLGWLGLDDLPAGARAEVLRRIRTELVERAERELPDTVPDRPGVLTLLRELIRLTDGVV